MLYRPEGFEQVISSLHPNIASYYDTSATAKIHFSEEVGLVRLKIFSLNDKHLFSLKKY